MKNSDDKAGTDVDQGDDDAGNGIAADKFRGTVHGSVEIGLVGDLFTAPAGGVLVDQAGIEIGVNGHLLARHGVQGEAGRHLGDPAGAFGDDDEVDDDQDDKDHQSDHIGTADDKLAKGLNDRAGRAHALVAVEEDEPG